MHRENAGSTKETNYQKWSCVWHLFDDLKVPSIDTLTSRVAFFVSFTDFRSGNYSFSNDLRIPFDWAMCTRDDPAMVCLSFALSKPTIWISIEAPKVASLRNRKCSHVIEGRPAIEYSIKCHNKCSSSARLEFLTHKSRNNEGEVNSLMSCKQSC